jgi:hypothetical protein
LVRGTMEDKTVYSEITKFFVTNADSATPIYMVAQLARQVDVSYPPSAERSTAQRKLLEAYDALQRCRS